MTLIGWIIIIILNSIILILSISILHVIKKATYFNKKDKELINFVIDMYIEYGEEINIISEDKHDVLVEKLNELKNELSKM